RSFEWYYLWKLCDPRPVALTGHTGDVLAIAYSPDPAGRRLATGDDGGTVRIWDTGRGEVERVLPRHTAGVAALAFRPDGQLLASGSSDGTVRFWDVATGECRRPLSIGAKLSSLSFSPDGRTLAVMTVLEDRFVLWDVESGREVWAHDPPA